MKTKVLITGASGFLGKIIGQYLSSCHQITTLGMSGENQIHVDLANFVPALTDFTYVVHAAGKAHTYPKTLSECRDFYRVNVNGTGNLLKALDRTNKLPSTVVYISSVAVYGKKTGTEINEKQILAAKDPYGRSKILAEQKVLDWCLTRGVKLGVLRLPVIFGPNPRGNFNKMLEAIQKRRWFHVRKGEARRSMVLASDVAEIIPEVFKKGGIYNLTDGWHPSYKELYLQISSVYGKQGAWSIPFPLAYLAAKMGDWAGYKSGFNSSVLEKLTNDLIFSDAKARKELGWNPRPVIKGLPEITQFT